MESIQPHPGECAREFEGEASGALILPLWRSRWLILSFLLLGGAAGIVLGIVRPNRYLSTAKLLVRHGAREESTPEAVIAGPGGQAFGRPVDLVNNEIQLLAVPQVFERVARAVTPQRIFAAYDPPGDDGEDASLPLRLFHHAQAWWFQRGSSERTREAGHSWDDCPACVKEATHALMKDIKLQGEPMSSVIAISYATHDPALASEVVGAFVHAAEEHHRETYSTDTTLAFVNQRLQASLAQVQTATAEFNDYRLDCEVFDYEAQRAQLMALLQDLEKQAAEDASKLGQLRSSSTALVALLTESRKTLLQQRLFELQDSLEALNDKVGGTTAERGAERVLIERRIERTKAELLEPSLSIEPTTLEQAGPNSRHQRLTQELDDLKQQIAAQESVTSGVAAQLTAVRSRLITTEQCEPRYRFLQATAKNAQASYDAFVKTHERTNLMNLLDQLDFSNLRRIQDPTLALEKEGPKRLKLLGIGILLGGLAGGVLGLVRHRLDPFVRSPADVELLLGSRVVGIVPRHRAPLRLPRVKRYAAL